jgi:hypothetical protein
MMRPYTLPVVVAAYAFALASCSSEPELPVARCTDEGAIAISNPNSSALTELRITVTAGQQFVAEDLPPVEGKKTIEVPARSFHTSTYQPLGGTFDCSGIKKIEASFKINGQQRSMTAE